MNDSSNGQMTYQMDEWFIKWMNDISNGQITHQMNREMDNTVSKQINVQTNGSLLLENGWRMDR